MYRNRLSQYTSRLKNTLVALLFVGTQVVFPLASSGIASAGSTPNPAATLQQCRNGTLTSPAQCADLGGGKGWVTGNAGASDSHWHEGDSIAYRMLLSNITTSGSHTVTIQWDTTKGGKHTIDYLTSYNRTETTADPCSLVTGCGSPTTVGIPNDTNASIAKIPGVFTLFNGTISSVSAYTLTGPYSGDSSTSITINFTAGNSTPVLAWGGHIATQSDWGQGNSAIAVTGSPYHTRILDLDGSGGNQDRSLSAAAVFPSPAITTQVSSAAVYLGASVSDVATLTGISSNTPLKGTVAFYICGPTTTITACTTGGTQVGTAVSVTPGTGYIGTATSATTSPLSAIGNYCFRTEFTPAVDSPYSAFIATDTTHECVLVSVVPKGDLTLIKHVSNTHGGLLGASSFTMHITNNSGDVVTPFAGSEAGTSFSLVPGTYTVSEGSLPFGYSQFSIMCDGVSTSTVTITDSSTHSCTITNNDIAPRLVVIKKVINDNSGTSTANQFNMNVNGTDVSSNSFSGSEAGTTITLKAGTYTVSEGAHDGYTSSLSTDCVGTIDIGQTKTCTVTNDDIAHPNIHVVKTGPATAHEGDTVAYQFAVTNTGDTTLSGTTVSDNIAGNATYQSGDTGSDQIMQKGETWIFTVQYHIPSNQTANIVNIGTSCAFDPAQTKVCDTDTHTLDVLHPAIKVVKSGPMYGYGGQLIGYTFVVTNIGDTTLSSVYIDDNIALAEQCDATTLAPAASTNCTASFLIPNSQIANVVNTVTAYGTDSLSRTVTAQDNHTLDVIHPAIHVVKTGPATAHEGDTVSYTFTVTNAGDIPLSNLTVQDNIAPTSTYQSGDTNSDGILDLNETWIYTAPYTIPANQTANVVNTVTACGLDPIQATIQVDATLTCDTDTHTLDVLHPAIMVVKTASQDSAYQSDAIVYTFKVTNTGDTPISDVTVNDDLTDGGIYQTGDSNKNGLLDLTETWTYTSNNYTVPTTQDTTITNTVTVCGSDSLDKNVCGKDHHDLHIYHPTITVVKRVITSQDGDNGKFNLQIDGQTAGTGANVGDNGTTGTVEVAPGTHTVGETAGDNTDLANYVSSYSDSCANSTVVVLRDQKITCTITNTRRGSVIVTKYNDFNRDGNYDSTSNNELGVPDPTLSGWQINLGEMSQTTGNYGTTTFSNISSGSYSLDETMQTGWTQSNITCDNQEGTVNSVYLAPGATAHCYIGNYQSPVLNLTKTNNRPNPTFVGDTVTYSLVVTIPNNSGAIFDATVTDLPPKNFSYVHGSWTARSTVRGDLKLFGTTTEPTYGSPGVWQLGNMLPGEVVTLTYQAKIGASVSDGTYPDLAFVKGFSAPEAGTAIFGNLSFSATPFVGTKVTVISVLAPHDYTAEKVIGPEVLVNTGATILPAQYILPTILVGIIYVSRRASHNQQKEGK